MQNVTAEKMKNRNDYSASVSPPVCHVIKKKEKKNRKHTFLSTWFEFQVIPHGVATQGWKTPQKLHVLKFTSHNVFQGNRDYHSSEEEVNERRGIIHGVTRG